jgi:hypothetical protein
VRLPALVISIVVAVLGVGCRWLDDRPAPARAAPYTAAGQAQGALFTSARPTFGAAVRDFLWVAPAPVQPVEFPHNIHAEKGMTCVEYCHEAATKGPEAGLPSVNTCMICHAAIATDKPLVQQITAMQEKGLDLHWHGDIARQTVAQMNVTLDMGMCVTCHKEKNAPNDCLTCHY